jgi:hypothetical protein
MNSSRGCRIGVGIVALICLLCVFSPLAFAAITDKTMMALRPATADDIRTRPKGLPHFKAGAGRGWGLWMEADMVFLDGERVLEPEKLKLEWQQVNGRILPAVGTADGGKRIVLDAFDEEDALRLALWVARSEISIPFSAPPIDHPAREFLKKQGYVPPTHGFMSVSARSAATEMVRNVPRKDSLILMHPVLDTSALVQAMGYIDFSDNGQMEPLTRMVVVPLEDKMKIVNELNSLDDVAGSGQSYTNADLHANFTCDLTTRKLGGTPLRYYWSHDEGGNIVFHLVARFVEPESLPREVPKELQLHHRPAIELYRLASVFSSFAEHNKEGLKLFIDEAFDRDEGD